MVLSVFCPGLNDRQNPGVAKDVPPASGVPVKRMPGWLAIPFLIAIALMASPAALADELQDYQKECDETFAPSVRAIATVRDFHCDAGAVVPNNEPNSSGKCNQPNRLNKECDPGSTFQVLTNTKDAYVVANCRKEKQPDHIYADIAVIQYNRKNGATCFYQALGQQLPEHAPAPSDGLSIAEPFWLLPHGTAQVGCGGCHDNGPFIRSPYLNQVDKGQPSPDKDNRIPGKDDRTFNRDQLYAFVGKDFAAWKAFKVEIKGNLCTSCHRLGVNNVPVVLSFPCSPLDSCGTARDFAERATSATEISEADKNDAHKSFPPSISSPMWMPPECPDGSGQACFSFNPDYANAAKDIHDCAMRWRENKPLPNNCTVTKFAEAYVPISKPISMMPIYYYLRDDLTDLTQIYYYLLND